jgi:hypothetical protein
MVFVELDNGARWLRADPELAPTDLREPVRQTGEKGLPVFVAIRRIESRALEQGPSEWVWDELNRRLIEESAGVSRLGDFSPGGLAAKHASNIITP